MLIGGEAFERGVGGDGGLGCVVAAGAAFRDSASVPRGHRTARPARLAAPLATPPHDGQLQARLRASTGPIGPVEARTLLLSVRSGGRFSMPGMMETILDVGLNDV